jgi:peptidoglycan biosynthesis protein MviN/MurJ (putative lipid II flippase)
MIPLITSGVTAGVFILLGWILSRLLGAPGIGLANTIAFTLNALLLFWLIERRIPTWLHLGKPLGRIGLASLGSGVVIYALLNLLPIASLSTMMSAVATMGLLGLGALLVLPFIWKDVKMIATI